MPVGGSDDFDAFYLARARAALAPLLGSDDEREEVNVTTHP
jgi:hypothetical protein